MKTGTKGHTGNPVRLFLLATAEQNVPLAFAGLGSRRVFENHNL